MTALGPKTSGCGASAAERTTDKSVSTASQNTLSSASSKSARSCGIIGRSVARGET